MTDITILIIDDEKAVRQSYADYLEDCEFNTILAKNGREGLELLEKESVDLVLVDLRMPEVDGLSVLKRLKDISPDTPSIVISGTGVISDAIEAIHQGAWDYLLKPIRDFSVLNHAISKTMEKAQLIKENREYQIHLEQMVEKRTIELQKKTEDLELEIKRRKEVEIKIKESLLEKEILLQEIHHRVKNNMAIISSFLGLKEAALSDKYVKAMFKDSQQRIKSMALVHDKMYRSENFKDIKIKDYLEEMITDMVGNYNNNNFDITWDFHVEDVSFSLNIMIPICLITNEILTNSFKHAFVNVENPNINITLQRENDSMLLLQISDNGIGFDLDEEKNNDSSIGIGIIKALASQISGAVELESDNGTRYTIRFPSQINEVASL